MGSYTPTPEFGNRLLPTIVDEIARDDPSRVFVSLPYDDDDLTKGYEDVTFPTYANAINKLAWFIESSFGKGEQFPTIAYLGIPDIRYQILMMAVAKTGHKALFSSHMNSLAGHLALMNKTDADSLLSASGVKVDDILTARPVKHAVIPELDDLLSSINVKPYAFSKSFEEAKNDPFLILHTSGTTGLPKPVIWTHACAAAVDGHGGLPAVDPATGRNHRRILTHPMSQRRVLVPFMHFHGIAAGVLPVSTVFGNLVWIPGFRNKTVSRDHIFDIIEHARPQDAFLSPAMLEDLANHPDCERYVSKLDNLLYGGAPLNAAAGKALSRYTKIRNQWGITESGKVVDLELDPADFEWLSFDTVANGMEFRKSTDDLYEMIIHRNSTSEKHIAYFHREPKADTWHVGDLWRPHPDPKKAGYTWKFAGRTDDLISYKDGNNFYPVFYELKYSEHELVKAAVISGTGHRQAVLLLELNEPTSDPSKQKDAFDKLWDELVVPINKVAPANGQIGRTHMLLASPEKGFERNVKGTVARKATLISYEAEISKCYEMHGDQNMDVESRFEKK